MVIKFLNKFAAKCCKRVPHHLNSVCTTLWNLKCSLRKCYHWIVTRETPAFIPLQLWPPNWPDLNPVDNSMWEILQETMYKTCTIDLELSTAPLKNGCRNDDMI